MQRLLVHEQGITLIHDHGTRLAFQQLARNRQTEIGRTVVDQPALVAPGPHTQAAVLHIHVHKREPDRQHLRLVRLRPDHPMVLVDHRLAQHDTARLLVDRRQMFRRLEANMLYGVGVNLAAEDGLD